MAADRFRFNAQDDPGSKQDEQRFYPAGSYFVPTTNQSLPSSAWMSLALSNTAHSGVAANMP